MTRPKEDTKCLCNKIWNVLIANGSLMTEKMYFVEA